MKNGAVGCFFGLRAGLIKSLSVGAIVISLFVCTSCAESKTGDVDKNYVEGAIVPADNTVKSEASASNHTVTFQTDGAYTLESSDEQMLTIVSGYETGAKNGAHSAKVQVAANTTGSERTASLFIIVSGHKRTTLYNFVQSAASQDKVVEWIDQRLKTEYYWLDEYIQKRANFDFTLAYDKFLSTSLLSMTSNKEDGGTYESTSGKTERYLYSYITREESSTASSQSTRTLSTVSGYGIELASTVWVMNETKTLYGFAVKHVYDNSPAANAGLRRGDIITKVDGNDLTQSNYARLWSLIQYNEAASVKILKQDQDGKTAESTIARGSYYENPIAYYGLLELPDNLKNQGKNVGYLCYLSFDADFDDNLDAAMSALKASGVTDLILDLRSNGGGSVNSSIRLASMILGTGDAGKVYADLKRNPANSNGDTRCLLDSNVSTNLGLKKLWIITSDNTASASEMVIVGLRGLDIPVTLIGTKTEGKNCGMDVMKRLVDGYTYTFAPITFMNYNAKGDNNYSEGLTPDIDMETYFATDEKLKQTASYYPMPVTAWGDYSGDIALAEAMVNVFGKTLLTQTSTDGSFFKTAPSTRALERGVVTIPVRKVAGATLTEQERRKIEAAR